MLNNATFVSHTALTSVTVAVVISVSVPSGAQSTASGTFGQPPLPDSEAWKTDTSIVLDTRTQAVASDANGNVYVAGVASIEDSYVRFLLKLDRFGQTLWRFESDSTSAYAGIANQEVVIDEPRGAVYVLRSNIIDTSDYLISVARHRLSDGGTDWNVAAGVSMSPMDVNKPASFGVDTAGDVWVAYQSHTNFAGGWSNWTIDYQSISAATGSELGNGLLVGAPGTERYLVDMSVRGDRLFLAYREQGPSNYDLVVTGFDVSSGTLTVVNPHEPSPCSSDELCRQQFTFVISQGLASDQPVPPPTPVTFTDASFDALGNFAVVGYYREMRWECGMDCFRYFSYYPVVVKVDSNNRLVFKTVETGYSQARLQFHDGATEVSAHVTPALGAGRVLVLVTAESRADFAEPPGVVSEFGLSGTVTGTSSLPSYSDDSPSGDGCETIWRRLWRPAYLAADVTSRLSVTGLLSNYCLDNGNPLAYQDTSRTVSFTLAPIVDGDMDGVQVEDDCDDRNAAIWFGNTCVTQDKLIVTDADSQGVQITFPQGIVSGGQTNIEETPVGTACEVDIPPGVFVAAERCVSVTSTASFAAAEVCMPNPSCTSGPCKVRLLYRCSSFKDRGISRFADCPITSANPDPAPGSQPHVLDPNINDQDVCCYRVSASDDPVICGYVDGFSKFLIVSKNDSDSDQIPDDEDNCPTSPNAFQTDSDADQLGDSCDHCPNQAGPATSQGCPVNSGTGGAAGNNTVSSAAGTAGVSHVASGGFTTGGIAGTSIAAGGTSIASAGNVGASTATTGGMLASSSVANGGSGAASNLSGTGGSPSTGATDPGAGGSGTSATEANTAPAGHDNEGGCSCSRPETGTSTSQLAAFALVLSGALRRRKRR
jgi:MYXO-CTERM domain-containing protein